MELVNDGAVGLLVHEALERAEAAVAEQLDVARLAVRELELHGARRHLGLDVLREEVHELAAVGLLLRRRERPKEGRERSDVLHTCEMALPALLTRDAKFSRTPPAT